MVRFLVSQLATGVAGAGTAAAAGGNRKKKQLKSSLSMGFRSYIRQFLGAILMLFRPSLPRRFAAGSGSVFGVATCYRIRSRSSSSSSRRKKQLKSSFSMGFRSYIRQFLGAILMLFRPSLPWGFAARSLGFRRVAGAAAAAAGGNRRKKSLKSSFSMGFRSYIRQFSGAILMLFRHSLPWGFAAGSGSIFGVAVCNRSNRSRSSSSSSREQEEKVATIIFSMGFRKVAGSMGFSSYIRQVLDAILMLFRPSLPLGFAAGSGSIFGVAVCNRSNRSRSSSSSSSRKQEEKVATIIFPWVSEK